MWTLATMGDLVAMWTVLETEAAGVQIGQLRTLRTEVKLSAGAVEVAVDGEGHRHLLLPLLPGEAVEEDRTGRAVQLHAVRLDHSEFVSLQCHIPALNGFFARLAEEILDEVADAASPARAARQVFGQWRELLAASDSAVLGDDALAGLLAELMCLEEIVTHAGPAAVDTWAGPTGGVHDFRNGQRAMEVKATRVREGRVVKISSVDQLDPTPGDVLHLAVHRFGDAAADEAAETLPGIIDRLLDAGVGATELFRRLTAAGYSPAHETEYRQRGMRLVERRVYDVTAPSFPTITRSSFVGGQVPLGALRISYSIDLTNEPPEPLPDAELIAVWANLGAKA